MISKIAKYPVEAELGRGGFGVVYRAYDPDVGRPVAIKVLTAESDSDLFKRFQDEVGTTGNLTHTNIVVVYESGNESGVPYLVMELLSGRTLQDLIKKREPMPLLEKVRIMTQVAEGLKYAHQKNVIHRDVKPGNVMVRADGLVKIMDFGIARVTTRSTVVTREGYIIGTIPYMAPEQFETGGKADKQTDIFGFGAVYYELLTGKHPFETDGNIYGTIERIKMAEPDSMTSQVPECPEALELLIYRAIAKDRDVRYASFDELLLDSDAILSDLLQERAALVLKEVPALIESGDIDAAENILNDVAATEPGNREARRYRKIVQDEKDRRRAAVRLPGLLEESEAHLRERRFGDAVRTLETATRLTRNDPTVQARLAEAQARLEGHRQANKLISEARRDQQKGQLAEALQRLKTALELDPQHPDASALNARLEIEIQQREKESQLQQVIAAVSELLANKQYDEALAALEAVGPEQIQVADLRTRVEREFADEERRNRADRFNAAVADIREALHAHELTRAGDLLDRLSFDFADFSGTTQVAADLRVKLDAQIREDAIASFSQQAQDLIGLKWFREALNLVQEALQRFPEDTGLRRLEESTADLFAAQQRSDELAAALKRATAFRDAGDLPQALDSIFHARRRIGDDKAFDDLERQFQMEYQQHTYAAGLDELLARVKALTDAGGYTEAIRVIEAAAEYQGESEVRSALASARTALAAHEEQELADSAIQAAEDLERQGTLDQAVSGLQDARQKYPNNRALSQAMDRIEQGLSRKQRQARIAGHQAGIEQSIHSADWKGAENAIRMAQREYPEETLFESFADQVRRALFDAGLKEAASSVREKLAANAVSEAVEQVNVTRTVYSGDPRWKQLEQEVAQRKAYESALREANLERERGNLGKAEAMLTSLMKLGSFDDRLTQMLAGVQDQRISQDVAQASLAISQGDLEAGLAALEAIRLRATPAWASRIEEAHRAALRKKEEALAARARHEQELQATEQQAVQLIAQGKPGDAIALLEGLHAGTPRFQALLDRARLELDALRFSELLTRARALGNDGHYDEALKLLQKDAAKGARADSLLELERSLRAEREQQRQRETREHARVPLLAVEEQIDKSGSKRKLQELDAEARGIGSAHATDPEIKAIVTRIGQRIESRLQERAAVLSKAGNLLAEGLLDTGLQTLHPALRKMPDDSELLELKARIEAGIEQERIRRQRDQEIKQATEQATSLLQQGKQEEVIALIESRYPGEPAFEKLLARARAELRSKQLQDLLSRAAALGAETRHDEALKLVEQGLARHGQIAALTDLRRDLQGQVDDQRRQAARATDHAQLLAIEKQIESGPRHKKRRELIVEMARISAGYSADPEIASIVGRINQRVETAVVERAGAARVPWKPIAGGVAAAAALITVGLVMVHRKVTPIAVSMEISSDPAGAAVTLADHSCVTPDCRFDLTPGTYLVHATLNGYQPAEKTVTLESSSSSTRVDLTMQPMPPPPPPTGSKTGTLQVQTGLPDTQVFVDNIARGRTDSTGGLSLPLVAQAHDVRVEKNGFQTPKDQRVLIADGRSRPLTFKLIPQPATMELRGAPAGVDIRVGGTVLGRTDGSVFSAPVPLGNQTLQVSQGAANRQVAENFEAGRTVTLDWKNVAPAAPVQPAQPVQLAQPAQPAPAMIEARDWDQARAASDPAPVQAYLDKYPGGAYAAEALSRLDELTWSRNDPQAYLNRFPRGAHAAEAAQRLGEAEWKRVDQKDARALRAFLAQNPNNAHRVQAQGVLDQLEKLNAEETLRQERAKQQDAQKQLDAQRSQQVNAELLASKQQVLATLSRLNDAFAHHNQKELKAIWPNAPKSYLDAVNVARGALKVETSLDAINIANGLATVPCNVVTGADGASRSQSNVAILKKNGSEWTILSLVANR